MLIKMIIDDRTPGVGMIDLAIFKVQPKAWNLIRLLATFPGAVVSSWDIYESLWPDTVVEEAQLYFQARKLRTALDAASPGRGKLIVTFPKRGLMLDLEPREIIVIPPIPKSDIPRPSKRPRA